MKKLLIGVVLSAILLASPVLAAMFQSALTVVESDGNAYDNIGVSTPMNNDWMSTNGYITATGRDTRVVLGSTEYPHMLRDAYTHFAVPVDAYSTVTYQLTTDNTAQDMYIVPAYGGYITRADAGAAPMELGNNFESEFQGYMDTSAGATKNLIYKQNAFITYVSGAGLINSEIAEGAFLAYDTGDDSNQQVGDNWGGNTWDVAQVFTTTTAIDITSISVLCARGLMGGVGVSTVSIRLMGATPSSNPALTTGTADMDTNGWVNFNVADITLAAATQYVIVFDDTAGDSYWRYDSTGAYAGGNRWNNQNEGGWAEQAGTDLMFRINITPILTVTVASGVHNVKSYADGTWFMLSLDADVSWDGIHSDRVALGAVTVPDNANTWYIDQNNVMPYITYYKHTVNTVLIVHYQPADLITGTVLPDRQGAAENGTFVFGVNPAGVLVDVGALTLTDEATAAGYTITSPDYGDPVDEPTDWTKDDKDLTMPTNEFYDVVSQIATLANIDINMLWWWLASSLSIVAVATGRRVTNNVWVAGLLGAAASGIFVSMGGVELWIPAYIFIATVFVGVWQRTSEV